MKEKILKAALRAAFKIFSVLLKTSISCMRNLFIFKDQNLLRTALTHRSYVHEHPDVEVDNERLEFLGDAILNFLSGSYLTSVRVKPKKFEEKKD
jgi:ribonuclease-3